MTFPFRKVLVIGATSGIGLGLAERLAMDNVAVIAVGRRQERLDKFVHKHPDKQVYGVRLDIGQLDHIPSFADR